MVNAQRTCDLIRATSQRVGSAMSSTLTNTSWVFCFSLDVVGKRDKNSERVDPAAMRAVRGFVATFVVPNKRERAQLFLLGRPERRIATLQELPQWVEPTAQTDLNGNTGFPAALEKRFGNLRGLLLDDEGTSNCTIAEAVETADEFGALFISDSGEIALLIPEVGPPTLCEAKLVKRKVPT
jgi:hypothetical protein